MIRKKIISIIALALEKKESEISIESNNNNLQEWGSVQNLFISSDIENEFEIELTTDEIANFNSVLEIENIIKKYVKN